MIGRLNLGKCRWRQITRGFFLKLMNWHFYFSDKWRHFHWRSGASHPGKRATPKSSGPRPWRTCPAKNGQEWSRRSLSRGLSLSKETSSGTTMSGRSSEPTFRFDLLIFSLSQLSQLSTPHPHTHSQTHTPSQTHTHTPSQTHTHTHTHKHTHPHKHTHTHPLTNTHTRTRSISASQYRVA